MNTHKKWFSFVTVIFLVLGIVFVITRKKQGSTIAETNKELVQNTNMEMGLPGVVQDKRYQAKEFSVSMGAKKFSNKQISDHKQLYVGYVNKRNEIEQALQTADRTSGNISYSVFRALKLSETFTRNAALLHELYFENIGTGTSMGSMTQEIIIKNFGTLEAFKEDLMATALSARGWVLTCYNLDDGRVQNYLLDAHNEKVPVLTIPLLVVDTYEHAYMIDFGINRKEYLSVLWDNINWDVIEARVKRWAS